MNQAGGGCALCKERAERLDVGTAKRFCHRSRRRRARSANPRKERRKGRRDLARGAGVERQAFVVEETDPSRARPGQPKAKVVSERIAANDEDFGGDEVGHRASERVETLVGCSVVETK